ncbi:hypothetical protein Esi_0243_0019 [Ectocarpus siliculosus]|uniref:Uncharacterized protein n=1 Tax=Ectocarpus siliculosus TaxID=2880 RepID=D7FT07_ECTSI|nr:hypothetical protein Esi_0243_0019 [Ectocarpus siliculosus]|eukprot:CBJ31298.1 hypothetical protein Esi_0243_0019 [Ectocarpus siliculosus]
MTAAVCLDHCTSYEFYGTQYGTESDSSDAMTSEYSTECHGLRGRRHSLRTLFNTL